MEIQFARAAPMAETVAESEASLPGRGRQSDSRGSEDELRSGAKLGSVDAGVDAGVAAFGEKSPAMGEEENLSHLVRCLYWSHFLSRWGDRKLFSCAVDVGSTHNSKWDKEYSLRGLKPEDLTSSKGSKMLRSWSKNTPTDLANMGVPWNPFVVCGVLKSNIGAEAACEFFKWVKAQEGYRHNVYTDLATK